MIALRSTRSQPAPFVPRIAEARRLNEYIQDQLETRLEWHQRAGSGAWICPFCLAAAPMRPGGECSLVESIEEHLAIRCGPFGAGWPQDPGPRRLSPPAGIPWQG